VEDDPVVGAKSSTAKKRKLMLTSISIVTSVKGTNDQERVDKK